MNRKLLRGSWVALACLALASCGSEPSEETTEGTVEIFSWWTAGGEASALDALVDGFEGEYPGVTVQNSAVQGGAGVNAQELLRQRMEARQPPDLFQIHGGAELIDQWVAVGGDDSQSRMENLTSLFEENDWGKVYPTQLIDIISFDEHMYSVPVGVHRANVLYANRKIFAQHGLKVPTTWEEFFAAGDALKAQNVTPLALGSKEVWTATHLFEVVLLSTAGPDFYQTFFTGDISTFAADNRAKLSEAAELFGRVLGYTNASRAQLNWEEATAMVQSGGAAMTIMGDWAKGLLVTKYGWKPDVDFDELASPDTADCFVVVTDTFGMPVGAPNRANAIKMLTYLGSAEAQAAFAPLKGALPARSDVDVSKFDPATQRAAADLRSKRLVPTLTHGSAAAVEYVSSLHTAVGELLKDPEDTEAFVTRLVNGYAQVH